MVKTELLENLLQPDQFQVYIRTFNADQKFIKELEKPDSRYHLKIEIFGPGMEKLYYPLHHRFVEGDMKSTIYFLDPTVLCKKKDLILFLNSWYLEYIKGNEQKYEIPRGKGKKNWRKYIIGEYSPNTKIKHEFEITSRGIKVIKPE